MANLGKCVKCGKTCYQLEGLTVGPPGGTQVYHKLCFKCQNDGCNWQLTLNNYKFCDGRVYCPNHCPMTGFSNRVQGSDVHAKGKTTTEAMHIDKALRAPRRDLINEQVRGLDAGQQQNVVARGLSHGK